MKKVNKNIPVIVDIILMIFLLFCLMYQGSRLYQAETQLLRLKHSVRQMEQKQRLLAEELHFRTDPAQIDANQRAWFEELLKNNPEQVRGISGKYPKEGI